MKTTLPVREKTLLDDGSVKVKDYDIDIDVDTSIYGEMRWEEKFPLQASQESLDVYTKRVFANEGSTLDVMISKFKSFYCWVDIDKPFKDFVKIFTGSLSDKDYKDKLLKKMENIVKAISNSSAEKN